MRNKMASTQTHLIGTLPKVFIGLAFVNFLVGASLGGWMATRPALWSVVGSLHGEINPFGWLTMLIYGMTYAVLSASAGLSPPKAWVGWLHVFFSELAVVIVTTAFLGHNVLLLQIGATCQFVAPALFLSNILSAVFNARRVRDDSSYVAPDPEQIHALSFLKKGPIHQSVDSVAQRGTDVSLILFLIGAGWMMTDTFAKRDLQSSGGSFPQGALFLVYYGWILGIILAVSLHLFPRFIGTSHFHAKGASVGQVVWGVGVVAGTAGSIWSPAIMSFGYRLLGVSLVGFGLTYLRALLTRDRVASRAVLLPQPSIIAWYASWTSCFVLGICLVIGLNPQSLTALHLLFLAFATNLVYGVGYTMFPLLLRRKAPSKSLSIAQISMAILGGFLMIGAFLRMTSRYPFGAFTLLGVGGTLAAVAAVAFLLQWPLSKKA